MSSKFLTESTGEKIVTIGQYLAKIWTKYNSLLFFGPPCRLGLRIPALVHLLTLLTYAVGSGSISEYLRISPNFICLW